jgi:ADP-heptose:LPS heptosyltransferase
VPGVSYVCTDNELVPSFELCCPLMSLPLAFGTELATIPAKIPYIWPFEESLAKWRSKMPATGRLRVGICWAGNSVFGNDRNRSIPLDKFAALLSVPNVDFISVQKDVNEADAAVLRECGVLQLGQEFSDFVDTAAVIAMLDLVISVDTSVAHLAGAMGKAVALLLPFAPDWRWMLGRTDSPWYPSLRLFRQNQVGDWREPFERLHAELAEVSQQRTRTT